jgi:hypothetical protein
MTVDLIPDCWVGATIGGSGQGNQIVFQFAFFI